MSVRKLTAGLLTALAIALGTSSTTNAQEFAPFVDPFAFDPDFHWFEPVYDIDLAGMKSKNRAPYGWFGTYDRLNFYGSRPELDEPNISERMLDSGWGNRYEFGYMLPDEDNGWMFTWTATNIGAFHQIRRERLNRINTDQLTGGGTNVGPPFGEIVPQREQNNRGYNERFFDVTDTENVFSYDSYELNKTWRLEPYHYGGILEPLVGVRWIRLKDINAFQSYTNANDTDLVPYTAFPNAEQLLTDTAVTENEMFGGQIGFRYFKYRDRFTFGTDLRVFFGGNWQTTRSTSHEFVTVYDGAGIGSDVSFHIDRETDPIYSHNEEFYFGFDVRGEVGYQLTRQLSVRTGFQLIDIAQGVWRGGDGTFVSEGANDQDVVMFGVTFGVNLNH